MSTELNRLAQLETALVGAAAAQATRRRRRRRRSAVLAVVVAPLVLVAAGSVARTGTLRGVDHNLSVLRDDRAAAPAGAAGKLTSALGARSSIRENERSWVVGGQKIVGYRTQSGRFCFAFIGVGDAGCVTEAALTVLHLVPNADRAGRGFRLYGLAADDVTAVTLRVGGVTHRAAISRNAFYLQLTTPVSSRRFTLTLLAHLRDGGTTQMRVPVADDGNPTKKPLQALPGTQLPVENTAA